MEELFEAFNPIIALAGLRTFLETGGNVLVVIMVGPPRSEQVPTASALPSYKLKANAAAIAQGTTARARPSPQQGLRRTG